MIVNLARLKTVDQGTTGVLLAPGFSCYTKELPWRDNQQGRSCIPAGDYEVTLHDSPRFGKTYWVRNVPGRSSILFHAGNLAGDIGIGWKTHSEGCILVGKKLGSLDIGGGKRQDAVLLSRPTHRDFMATMGGMNFTLRVRNL